MTMSSALSPLACRDGKNVTKDATNITATNLTENTSPLSAVQGSSVVSFAAPICMDLGTKAHRVQPYPDQAILGVDNLRDLADAYRNETEYYGLKAMTITSKDQGITPDMLVTSEGVAASEIYVTLENGKIYQVAFYAMPNNEGRTGSDSIQYNVRSVDEKMNGGLRAVSGSFHGGYIFQDKSGPVVGVEWDYHSHHLGKSPVAKIDIVFPIPMTHTCEDNVSSTRKTFLGLSQDSATLGPNLIAPDKVAGCGPDNVQRHYGDSENAWFINAKIAQYFRMYL